MVGAALEKLLGVLALDGLQERRAVVDDAVLVQDLGDLGGAGAVGDHDVDVDARLDGRTIVACDRARDARKHVEVECRREASQDREAQGNDQRKKYHGAESASA